MTSFQSLPGRVRIFAGEAAGHHVDPAAIVDGAVTEDGTATPAGPPPVAGAGVQLTAEHVLTCWHVVHDGAGSPRTPLAVDSPLRPGPPMPVTVAWSRGIGARGEGDLALLRTGTPLPTPPGP